jgi:outer membrane immunogenic protein
MSKLALIAAAAVVALTCEAADASDLDQSAAGLKDGSASAAAFSWTGVYIGGGVGGGAAASAETGILDSAIFGDGIKKPATATTNKTTTNSWGGDGFDGTVQFGADYHFTGSRLLVGVFGDYDFTKYSSTETLADTDDIPHNGGATWSLHDQWTIGGRIGVLSSLDMLFYGLAGYSQASQTMAREGVFNVFPDNTLSKSMTTEGWTFGAGAETRLAGGWFLKGEYRYTDFDDGTLCSITTPVPVAPGGAPSHQTETRSFSADVQSARAVLVYKLGAARPEPSK